MSNDEEIKVALTADVSDLEQGAQEGAETVAQATGTMQAAVEESTAAITDAVATIAAGFESAAAQVIAASGTMSEGISASTSSLAATLQAEAAAQAQALAESISMTAEEAVAFNTAVTAKNEALLRLQIAMRTGVTTTAQLAEAELALDQAMQASALTIAEYNAVIAQLNIAEASMAEAAQAATTAKVEATTAVEAETVALGENAAAMEINAGVARELGVLTGEGLRGNFTRMEGSVITLANRMGLMQAVFSPLGMAITATGAAVAGFAYEVYKGEQQSNEFNKALINTGGALGVTEGQFNDFARSMTNSETTIGSARQALQMLADTGRFSGETLQTAGQAAVDFAALTGKSMQESVSAIVKLQEDPVKALLALNQQYHFLTEAEIEYVQKLQDEGDKVGAATEAINYFGQVHADRLKAADQDVGVLTAAWRGLKAAISEAGDDIQSIGRKSTIGDQIADAKRQIAILQSEKNVGSDPTGHADEDISRWQKVIATLENVQSTEQHTAEIIRQRQQVQDNGASASAELEQLDKQMKGVDAYTEAMKRDLAIIKQVHDANADSDKTKGFTFDDEGNVNGGDGLAKLEAFNHKKYDLKATAHASEHKLDEQELQLEEAQEGISYDKRLEFELEFWQKKMAAASKGSQEYAQAYRQVQTLQKELDDESVRSANRAAQEILHAKLAAIDQAKSAYDGEIESSKERYQIQYDSGQITASRLAELEKDLVQKKLAADIQYLTAKMELDRAAGQSGVDAANREATAIEVAKQKAATDMEKIDDKYVKDSEKDWEKYSTQISRTFGNSIRGMLFEGQSFKQGMASIGESMASNFINNSLRDMVMSFAHGETTKTSAAAAGAAARTAIESDSATQSKAIDAETGKSQITSAAATGAAKAYQAVVGIPYVGPVLAPIAAFVAFAGIEAFAGSLSSAAGGWDNVPHDQLAMIHKNEMVMPAHLAEGIRGMIGNGTQQQANSGGGGDTHIHHWNIQTFDGRSTEQFFRKNFGAISKGISAKTKNTPQARR